MAKYLFEAKYTAEGAKGVMKEGGSKRREAADQAIRSAGGKLESMYFAFGEADVVGIVDFPDYVSAVAMSGAINGSGTKASRILGPRKYSVDAAPICAPIAAPVCITSAIIMSTLPLSAWLKVP